MSRLRGTEVDGGPDHVPRLAPLPPLGRVCWPSARADVYAPPLGFPPDPLRTQRGQTSMSLFVSICGELRVACPRNAIPETRLLASVQVLDLGEQRSNVTSAPRPLGVTVRCPCVRNSASTRSAFRQQAERLTAAALAENPSPSRPAPSSCRPTWKAMPNVASSKSLRCCRPPQRDRT